MSSAKTDFQRLNMEVQEKLDCALQQFQEMKMERDNAVRMLHKYQRWVTRVVMMMMMIMIKVIGDEVGGVDD